jgi:hypothetical protein
MNVRERFRPQPMAANSTYVIKGPNLGGFLATVSGTLTITDNTSGTVLVNAVAVTAGIYTPLPFVFDASAGATVVLAGGAAGTLAV